MNLNFRSIVIAICLCKVLSYSLNGQTKPVEKQEQLITKNDKSTDWARIILSAAVGYPLSYGDTFLKTYSKKTSHHFNATFFLNPKYIFGYDFNIYKATTDDTTLTGNFDNATICHYYMNMGRQFTIHNFPLSFRSTLGAGWANYRNEFKGVNKLNFKDNGFSMSITGTLQYEFTRFLGIHINAQWIRDFLRIETNQEIQSFFDRANYVFLYAGITFSLR
ncbi:hypothetical protein NBT05_14390 [Aquimarina sp. ERC-38]|uniref:hypothetical protein n=1 Tax=Aquimarina sp. ERC-38 TaxID=2949996 RepID=UPI0022463E3C|nr:hypothetical protein [Aquimarina sp. ERC-38]UZO80131.1 hypothetical protein NBT05_14390 [Aquimarina sp. ERC-38]